MAEPSLEGCREKWARGTTLLQHVVDEASDYSEAEPKPYEIAGSWDANRKQYVFTGETTQPMDKAVMWSVILGDAVHNLRSALDHLVWQLVLLDTGKDGTTDNQFPIASHGDLYWGKAKNNGPSLRERRLKGVSKEHKRIIDRVQPYRTNAPGKLESLEALRDMSNHDKHRLLHTVMFAVDIQPGDSFGFSLNEDAGDWVRSHTEPFPSSEPGEVLICDFSCPGPDPQVSHHGDVRVVVGIDPIRARLVDLPKIGESVLDVIDSVADDFPGV
jgi:hypothetical protein